MELKGIDFSSYDSVYYVNQAYFSFFKKTMVVIIVIALGKENMLKSISSQWSDDETMIKR